MGLGLMRSLRRWSPGLADRLLAWQETRLAGRSGSRRRAAIFSRIAEGNLWGSPETRSGPGSTLAETAALRDGLREWLVGSGVRSLVDLPCGDAHWVREILGSGSLERYVGIDIVASLIETNRLSLTSPGVSFEVGDLCEAPPPAADAVLCRDLFIHLPLAAIHRALANLAAAKAKWLLLGSYRGVERNREILTGQWRPVDLERVPFGLSRPRQWISEGRYQVDGQEIEKGIGVWVPIDLPPARA